MIHEEVVHVGAEPVPGACNWRSPSHSTAGGAVYKPLYCHEPGDQRFALPNGRTLWLCRVHAQAIIELGSDTTTEDNMRPPHPLMRIFQYDHLPENLQMVSRPFARLAHDTSQSWADWDDPLLDQFMLRLWEAKNLAVAAVAIPEPAPEWFAG